MSPRVALLCQAVQVQPGHHRANIVPLGALCPALAELPGALPAHRTRRPATTRIYPRYGHIPWRGRHPKQSRPCECASVNRLLSSTVRRLQLSDGI